MSLGTPTIVSDSKDSNNSDLLPYFLIVRGSNRGNLIAVHMSGIIGRDTGLALILDDPQVSRRHCEYVFQQGILSIQDLKSTNGIYINGIKKESGALSTEDYLQLGQSVLKLQFLPAEPTSKKNKEELSASQSLAETVLLFLNQNYSQKIELQGIADTLEITPSHLSTSFKKATGESLIEKLNQIRIEKACEKLCQDKSPVLRVADAVGFQNLSLFNRQFKKMIGITPSEYRKKYTSKI